MTRRIHQQILRLDVPVADPGSVVQMRQRPARLVHVQLHQQGGHPLPSLGVMLRDPVDRLRHELEHQVQVDLVPGRRRVEAVAQADDVWVPEHLHHRQLPVLEPSVLEHLFDGDRLSGLEARGLKHDAEGAVADDAGGGEGEGRAGGCRGGGGGRSCVVGVSAAAVARRRSSCCCCRSSCSPHSAEGGDGGGPDDVGARGRVSLDDAALVGLRFEKGF